jgi:PAT family beta-lactamase induction signal transducer AmpG
VGGVSGFVVASFGYAVFFALTAAVGVPVVLLCLWLGRSSSPEAEEETATPAAEPAGAVAARSG